MKEVKVLEGMLNAQGLRFGIVVSRFNEFFTSSCWGGHWTPCIVMVPTRMILL